MMHRAISIFILAACLLAGAGPAAAVQTFIDDSGQEITIKAPYKRIISLYGAHTENLFSLGLDQEIIGVSPNEVYPPAALKKPVFSYRGDPERFLAAAPDLVLVRPMIFQGYQNLVNGLKQAGIQVVSLQPRRQDDLYSYWRELGLLTGRQDQAEQMVQEFEQGLDQLRKRVSHIPRHKRPNVYFESIHRRMKTFAPRSMAIFVLRTAGGENLAPDADSVRGSNIAAYGKERIMALGDDMDVYLAQIGPMNKVTVQDIKNENGFSALKAVNKSRVYLVDEKLVSRPTIRLLQGIEAVQDLLYPGLAKAPEPELSPSGSQRK